MSKEPARRYWQERFYEWLEEADEYESVHKEQTGEDDVEDN